MNRSIAIVVISVLIAVGGQIMLKLGMNDVGTIGLRELASASTLARVFGNWRVLLGLALYATSAVFYMVALSRVDLSLAYPIVGLSYVIIPLASWLLLGEAVPPARWIGISVIVVGVFLVARTA